MARKTETVGRPKRPKANIDPNQTFTVLGRQKWKDDDWVPMPWLEPLTANLATSPAIPTATFRNFYGQVAREDPTPAYLANDPVGTEVLDVQVGRLEVIDYFVCIAKHVESDGGDTEYLPLWVGIVPTDQTSAHGTATVDDELVPAGDQILTAYGLAYLLQRRRTTQANAFNPDETDLRLINHLPTFNERTAGGRSLRGNRSSIRYEDMPPLVPPRPGFFVFGDSTLWSALDIMEYMLASTNGGADTDGPIFQLDFDRTPVENNATMDNYLDSFFDVVSQEGIDVWSLLNNLFSRERGVHCEVTWKVEESDNLPGGTLLIRVGSQTDRAITIGSKRIPAHAQNSDYSIDDATALRTTNVQVNITNTAKYDRIKVRGRATVVCFTAATWFGLAQKLNLAQLAKAWTADEQSDYVAADADGRASDILQRVFRNFRLGGRDLDDEFSWTTFGEPVETNHFLNPVVKADGSYKLDANANFWKRLKPLQRSLPFFPPSEADLDDPKYASTFVLVRVLDGFGNPTNKWVNAHEVPTEVILDSGETVSLAAVGCNVTPIDREMGIEVRFSPNHLLGRNAQSYGTVLTSIAVEGRDLTGDHFEDWMKIVYRTDLGAYTFDVSDADDSGDRWKVITVNDASDYDIAPLLPETSLETPTPPFDYDQMLVTMALENDTPPSVTLASSDQVGVSQRQLVVTVPEAEVWIIIPGTVSGIDKNNELKTFQATAGDSLVRDDTELLESTALALQDFHGRSRYAIDVSQGGIVMPFSLMTIIRTAIRGTKHTDIHTPVTSIEWDFRARTTRWKTEPPDIQFQRIVAR